jgi:hypothetical protein
MPQLNRDLSAALAGQHGSTYINDQELHTCDGNDFWVQITVTQDCVFEILNDFAGMSGNSIVGDTFLHNLSIYGQFNKIKLKSGAVLAQHAGVY